MRKINKNNHLKIIPDHNECSALYTYSSPTSKYIDVQPKVCKEKQKEEPFTLTVETY